MHRSASCHYNEIPVSINLQRENVYSDSWFWRFQSMVKVPGYKKKQALMVKIHDLHRGLAWSGAFMTGIIFTLMKSKSHLQATCHDSTFANHTPPAFSSPAKQVMPSLPVTKRLKVVGKLAQDWQWPSWALNKDPSSSEAPDLSSLCACPHNTRASGQHR